MSRQPSPSSEHAFSLGVKNALSTMSSTSVLASTHCDIPCDSATFDRMQCANLFSLLPGFCCARDPNVTSHIRVEP
eukprot:5279374-Amphidinium_carterae.1